MGYTHVLAVEGVGRSGLRREGRARGAARVLEVAEGGEVLARDEVEIAVAVEVAARGRRGVARVLAVEGVCRTRLRREQGRLRVCGLGGEPEQRHRDGRARGDTAQHEREIAGVAPVAAHEAPRRRAQLLAGARTLRPRAGDQCALAGRGERFGFARGRRTHHDYSATAYWRLRTKVAAQRLMTDGREQGKVSGDPLGGFVTL